MSGKSLCVRLCVDGGARGNPGPAGAGVVVAAEDDGTVLYEAGLFLGKATNNVAEYSALIAGLEAAGRLKADEVHVNSDSQLMIRQMNGQYRVKSQTLKPLHAKADRLAGEFAECTFTHVPRDEVAHADRLVNLAIDQRKDVEDAAD